MKVYIFMMSLLLTIHLSAQENILWYKQPASKWVEALPVGNGRMGAMVFGDPNHERIQLNEETIWAGTRVHDINPEAKSHLREIQQLLLDGNNAKAYLLTKKYMVGTPPEIRSYQTLGDIYIDWADSSAVVDYTRQLELRPSLHTTSFSKKGIGYKEEVFLSSKDNILVVRITSSKKQGLTGTIRLTRPRDAVVSAKGKQLIMEGQIIDSEDPEIKGPAGAHLRFAAIADVQLKEGQCSAAGNALQVKGATELLIRFTAFSDYDAQTLNQDPAIMPMDSCVKILKSSAGISYSSLLSRHTKTVMPDFDRCTLSLGKNSDENKPKLPTDVRLANFVKGIMDEDLITLYFQYGRYLLMSSSREPARLPANLQGKWNEHMNAPWQSDYHTNINLQMNYWPADITNTGNTYEPLAAFMNAMLQPGRLCAKEMYGAGGWVMHHLTDIYGRTSINADPKWGTSPLAGAWMALNLYDHYDFTRDSAYLHRYAWPLIKGSADFIMDFLIPDAEGNLVTAPSMSPENGFFLNRDSTNRHVITYGPTIDVEIIKELFSAIRSIGSTMDISAEYLKRMNAVEAKLPPLRINRYGGIQEWIKDYDEEEPGHRHMSQLFGLYPGTTLIKDSALLLASRKTLEHRLANGGGHTGWSRSWMINFYARLKDGDQAGYHLEQLLKKSTLSNLFDNHPPFQIDGNFGSIAGIGEMLVQSHQGYIELLPALPNSWNTGSVTGLMARGNFIVSIQWADGKLRKATIRSVMGLPLKVKHNKTIRSFDLKKGSEISIDGELNLVTK